MKVVEGTPLRIEDLYIGRVVVVSNTVCYCPNCKDSFAAIGNSVAKVTEVIDDKSYKLSFLVNYPRCPRCKSFILSMVIFETSREEQRKKHLEILHRSGELN